MLSSVLEAVEAAEPDPDKADVDGVLILLRIPDIWALNDVSEAVVPSSDDTRLDVFCAL